VKLSSKQPIFIGFKLDGSLRRQLEALSGSERRYVSLDDTTFLMMCKKGTDAYVGKLVEDGLTTDRVEDVKRNVLSIMRRLCPDVRLPNVLEILPIELPSGDVDTTFESASLSEKSATDGW
jgi:hypothetical protein